MIKRQGGSGKKSNSLDKNEGKKEKDNLVRVEYIDHVLYKNTDHEKVRPIVRETVGWLVDQTDDYIVVLNDRTICPIRSESIQSESIFLLFKPLILGIWDLHGQSLRSSKNH